MGDQPPVAPVKAWFGRAEAMGSIFVSAIGMAMVESEIERLPDLSQRREAQKEFEQVVAPRFANRIIPLDETALRVWGVLRTVHIAGSPQCPTEMALEAAVAKSRGYICVGRYQPLFDHAKVLWEDPWSLKES